MLFTSIKVCKHSAIRSSAAIYSCCWLTNALSQFSELNPEQHPLVKTETFMTRSSKLGDRGSISDLGHPPAIS